MFGRHCLWLFVQIVNFLCDHRFPKDENRRLLWIQALHRDNFVPTKNTLICEAHFTTNDYQKRPDLIKLTNIAVPSIFNCQKNGKQNISQKKCMNSRLKSSQIPARKRHGILSDHTYVQKLPEELIISEDIGFQKSVVPSKYVVHTSKTGDSRVLDIESQSNIHTIMQNIESNLYLHFDIIQLFFIMLYFCVSF